MWILYCGITSGQCKILRHYLTGYSEVNPCNKFSTLMFSLSKTMMSQVFSPFQLSPINPSYHPVTPPNHPTHSKYPLIPSTGQHITSYLQPQHVPTVYHPYQQQQQLIQYPYGRMTNPLLSGHTRSHHPMSYPMYRPTMAHLQSSCDQVITPPAAAEQHFNSNVLSSGHTTSSWNSDQSASITGTISQQILKNPVKVLYLFQCFQEAQDNVLCEVLSESFDDSEIDISNHRLLSYQVVSLGFFLSRSHRKWKKLNLYECHLGDHGMSILHQYLCGDKVDRTEITKMNLSNNDLTGASSHLIADIISDLCPDTLWLHDNNIINVREISTAVTLSSTIKTLNMKYNGLTAHTAAAISDMMICLEVMDIRYNNLGDDGAELLSIGITNTRTLRILLIDGNNIGTSGTIAIANALSSNSSLEELDMGYNCNNFGQYGAKAVAKAITNNKTLKTLLLCHNGAMDKEATMIIINSLHYNNTITKLGPTYALRNDGSVQEEVMKINIRRNECNVQDLVLVI